MILIEKKRDNGWWIGSLSNGKRGYFPNNYVEVVNSPTGFKMMPVQSGSAEEDH